MFPRGCNVRDIMRCASVPGANFKSPLSTENREAACSETPPSLFCRRTKTPNVNATHRLPREHHARAVLRPSTHAIPNTVDIIPCRVKFSVFSTRRITKVLPGRTPRPAPPFAKIRARPRTDRAPSIARGPRRLARSGCKFIAAFVNLSSSNAAAAPATFPAGNSCASTTC